MILPLVRDVEEGAGRNDLIPFATDPGEGRSIYLPAKAIMVAYIMMLSAWLQTGLSKKLQTALKSLSTILKKIKQKIGELASMTM